MKGAEQGTENLLTDIRATIYPAILGALMALIRVYLTNRRFWQDSIINCT
jgi:hypothetical protein